MLFTDWTWINGVKLGVEFLAPVRRGQYWIVQLDLLNVRVSFTYYGQRL